MGTDAQNGQALLDALSSITDASAAKRFLLYVEPGTYDLGTGSLQMKQHVDIQGGGELGTLVTSGVTGVTSDGNCAAGKVNGANNAELRFLTVRNTAAGSCGVAILNVAAAPTLTHVTAEATGAGRSTNVGVNNLASSNPAMTDVTVRASGGGCQHRRVEL